MIKAIKQSRLLSGAMGIAAVSLLAASFTAEAAGRHDPGVNQRQANQQSRIGQGVRQGDLTRGETRHLERQQGHIAREEARYKADGHLSRGERADLHHDQNQASRDIRRERHDGDRRFSGSHGDVRHPGMNDGRFGGHDFDRGYRSAGFERGGYGSYGGHGSYGGDGRGPGASVDHRQFDQRNRIEQGIRSGELTRNEARGLFTQQRDIRQEERAYWSDGRLSRNERADLQQDLNAASRNIYNETHDAQERNRYRY
jgi:hypothetical protein